MIKPASLKNELFVVLIPGGLVADGARKLQRAVLQKYDLNKKGKKLPPLHVTLDRIKKERKMEAARIALKTLQETTGEINILLEDFTCLKSYENQFLVLRVKPTDSLLQFSERLHEKLFQRDISTLDNYEEWKYHITLVNNNFVDSPLSPDDFNRLCRELSNETNKIISRAKRLEIWRAASQEENRKYFSLDLRDDKA